MINAGTVAAYLTLDTSDFVKGIAAAGQTLTQFRDEQSDGFDGLGAVFGGLGSLMLEKVNDTVGAIGGSAALGALPETLRGKGALAAQGLTEGIGSVGAAGLRQFEGMIGAIGGSAALGALPEILRNGGAAAAQGFMNGMNGLQTAVSVLGAAVVGQFDGMVGAIGGSAALGALPEILRSGGAAAAQGFMNGMSGLETAVSVLGAGVVGQFEGMVGAIGGSAALGALPEILRSGGAAAAQGFMNGMNGLQTAVSVLGAAVVGQFDGMVGAIGNSAALGALPEILRSGGAAAAQGFMNGMSGLETAVSVLGAAVAGHFDGTIGAIGNSAALGALPETLRGKGVLAMQGLTGGMVSQGGAAAAAMSGMMSAVKSAAGAVSFVSVGSNIIGGILSGMNGRRAALMAAAGSIAASVSGVMRAALKINSPSRVMMEIGEFTARGMELGLTKGAESLYDTALTIAHGTAEALSGIGAASAAAGGADSYGFSFDEAAYDASYELYRASESGDRLGRLIDAVEKLAASQSTVEIDGRPFGRLVREYV